MNKKQPSMTSALVLITLVITIFTISLNIGHNSSTETKEGMEKVSGEIVRVTGMANTAEPLSFTIPSSGTIYTETEAGSGIFRNNVDAEIFDSRGRRLNPSSTSDDDKYLNADGDPTGNFDHARLSTNAFEFPNYLNARFNQNGNLLLGEQPVVRSDGEPLESTETLESITTKLLPNGNVEITSGNDIVIVNSDNVVVSTRQIDDATCFLPRTPITLNDGSKKQIQNIKVGDKVLSYDLKNKKPVVSEVLNVFSHLDNNYLIVNDKIKVTPYHNMYINN